MIHRTHIGLFGRRNAGKSSLVNAITGQALSVVSSTPGTTTDPVRKTMELLPLGPVMVIDTPGFDDEGALGQLRVKKTREILREVDIAVLVVDCTVGLTGVDQELIGLFEQQSTPCLIAANKCDLAPCEVAYALACSALTGQGIHELKESLARLISQKAQPALLADLINPGDFVVLVTPIDASAPKDRMILPQVQTIRAVLDTNAVSVATQVPELAQVLATLKTPPALVVTDSQVFKEVAEIVPSHIPLTSFSILFARYKGFLGAAIESVNALQNLTPGTNILIVEGCTHHRQCDDIGAVKLPRMLGAFSGKRLEFGFSSGGDFPEDLSGFKAVLHCGACMLNDREMQYRRRCAEDQSVPFTNYGIAIAKTQGILARSVAPLS